MKMNKKKLIYISVAVLLVTSTSIGTVFVLKGFQKSNSVQVTPKKTNEQADTLKAQALQAAKANQIANAKQLLQEARQIYIGSNNLDGVAGTDAQLYLINHPRYPAR
jgi:hypothetical protein